MTKAIAPNNILITGMPKSGKSTLVKNVIQNQPNKQGMLVEEVRTHDVRTGFKIVTAKGDIALLASMDGYSPITIGKFYVHINNLDYLLPPLFKYKDDDLLYLDEIGPMQLQSEAFKQLTLQYLNAPNPLIASISLEYEDSFIKKVKKRADVTLIEVTAETRQAATAEAFNQLSLHNIIL